MLRAMTTGKIKMKYFSILGLVALSLVSLTSTAEYNTLFLDLAAGDEIQHYRIGYGETPKGEDGEKVTSMVYLGYFASDDEISIGSENYGEQVVEIFTIGAGGFGYMKDPQEEGGAEFDFELSQTKLYEDDLDYDRTSIGFRVQLFVPVAAGLQTNVGFNVRPFFMALDWDDQAQLEYEYQVGLEYAFNWDIALYSHYRYLGAIVDGDDELQLAEGAVFGVRMRF